jgi:transcriptional regulator with XRE-family HTH domain
MADIAQSIDLNLPQKLRDRAYRRKFFWAESSARIAGQLIALRKRRGLNQTEVADLIRTKQPAISRAEQADYQNWNLNTLRGYAEALDARVRVLIEPAEDILKEYDSDDQIVEEESEQENTTADASADIVVSRNDMIHFIEAKNVTRPISPASIIGSLSNYPENQTITVPFTGNYLTGAQLFGGMTWLSPADPEKIALKRQVSEQQETITELRRQIKTLSNALLLPPITGQPTGEPRKAERFEPQSQKSTWQIDSPAEKSQ